MTSAERAKVIKHLSNKMGVDEFIFEKMTDSELKKEYEYEIVNIIKPFSYRWKGRLK